MIVKDRHPTGRPCAVELTDAERVIAEMFDCLAATGRDADMVMILLRGSGLPVGEKPDTPLLDVVLTPEFVDYLVAG